jgi:hypothetical protein
MAQENQVDPGFVYHVILAISQSKGSGGQNEKIRMLGTYASVGKAKDAAHRSLFGRGYERELFSTFETNLEVLEGFSLS